MAHTEFSHIPHYDIKEKKHLYYSSAIRLFFGGLINVFIPGFIYKQTGSLSYVFLFLMITSLSTIIVDIAISYKLINKYGTKLPMLVSLPFLILYYFFIYKVGVENLHFLYFGGIAIGIFTSLFRTAFHSDIAQGSKGDKKFGEKVANLYIVITIVGSIAPIIGGFFLDKGLQNILFITASIGILLSGIPLLLSAKKHKTLKTNTEVKLVKYLKDNMFSPLGLTLMAKGYVVSFIGGYYWPLFIFIMIGSFTKLGIITAISTLIVVALIYFTGKLSDKNQDKKLLKINLSIQYLNWLFAIMSFVSSIISPIFIYIIDMFQKFTGNINDTCITKNLYSISGENNKSNLLNILLNEISVHFFRVIVCSIILIISYIFGSDHKIVFYFPIFLLLLIIPFQYAFFNKRQKNTGSDKNVNKIITKNKKPD